MNQRRRRPHRSLRATILGVGAALALLLQATGASPAGSFVRLQRHVPSRKLANARDLGHLDGDSRLNLSIPLKLRDPNGLTLLLKRIYDENDSLYHQFLTPEEFTARYAATSETVAEISGALTNLGLNVTNVHSNHAMINVEGSVAAIENAFGTEIHVYQLPDGHSVYAPIAEPLVTQTMADQIQMIAGLHNTLHAHHHLRPRTQGQVNNTPVGGFFPSGIRKAYGLGNTALNGAGETLALFECDGYLASDISAYATQFGIPLPNITPVLVDGATGQPSDVTTDDSGASEVTLDIEMMVALAPGAKIRVYEVPFDSAPASQAPNGCTDQQWLDLLNRIASDTGSNRATSISTSWAFAEADGIQDGNFLQSENSAFQQMAAQGQAFFAAAGDTGSDNDSAITTNTVGVEDPASQPFVVGVGGTSLTTDGSGNYQSESVWNNTYGGGGGGISGYWPAPSWQVGVVTSANGGNSKWRSVPDVSLDADPATGYAVVFGNPKWAVIAGTSAAAPLWAAFTAIVNQQRVAAGLSRIGYPNPTLYQLGEGSLGAQAYHDITSGNNDTYYAVSGYDLASGWGSFSGAGFLQAFATAGLPPVTPFNFRVQTVSP